ncbi:hypothetical protein GPA27_24410 [Aromatoleum toluolicum]|uniref:Doubled CXXCH motif domain-containing protein n=1 Tax=Aromatoleum toluolicum TaxID=90060 RepID=A0ABX1NMG7_9RHOO|nr:cytochrome c3 family protein [Aromatoleum toluolicum]NMG00527.1 hypothetical protein [Aromatoleum toluolicum]
MKNFPKFHALLLIAAALFGQATLALAQNTNAKVSNTKHNLSATGPGTVKAATGASGTDQICVFCHTPHAANATAPGPLWNRTLSSATYTPYTSNSLDAEDILNGPIGQPGGASKLCLSCHDGTLALGAVANSPGSGTGRTISMVGTPDGKMPTTGNTTGYTRNLGVDLRNDHPISFTFDGTLATRDGEFRSPPYSAGSKTVVGIRTSSNKPILPLDHEGKVQCTSCHDPHLNASKFLRLNRFQKTATPGTAFDATKDQICLGCHDKNKDRVGTAYLAWSKSAHADSTVANYSYKAAAATQREFPDGINPVGQPEPLIKVWEAGCLNCHDTHTVQGSRRLLREGTDSASTPKAGGNPAVEETCYQCHTTTAASILTVPTMSASTGVPDIRTEFTTSGNKRMPIASADQPAGTEKHDIGGNFTDTFVNCSSTNNKCGADFIEDRTLLGAGTHTNRHVECTDCHNPHRVMKNALFTGKGAAQRTHVLGTNVASGPLRGTWGVEPTAAAVSTTTSFPETPTSYTVKRGDPGDSEDAARTNPYLTREYQLCLKCHSDYGAGATMPLMGGAYVGGTASGTNGMTRYTNVAAEFSAVKATDPPSSGGDQGEEGKSGTACGGNCDPNGTSPSGGGATGKNHRSWHPVMWPTGRDVAARTRSGTSMDNFRPPFNDTKVGTQTMYCSDCHGHSGSWTQGADASDTNNGPNLAKVQGPHGSPQNFILKGVWDLTVTPSATRDTNSSGGICGRCHNPNANSGFDGSASEASHSFTTKSSRPCMRCHIAVPHGWKNKAFLVNLECVGPEGGQTGNCTSVGSNTSTQSIAPYYNSAVLRINTWQASGQWTETSCGTSGYNGKDWMSDISGCQ